MKTIIEMAREAGLGDAEGWINEEYDYKKEILAFAELVATAEREACAKLVEDQDTYGDVIGGWFELLAEKIRARGNT